MKDFTDEKLVEIYRNGSMEAFKTLIERYLRPLYVFAYRMTGKSDEATDITQETFIKVWKTLHRYKKDHTFRPWIFTIARNTIIDHLRKKQVSVFSDFDDSEGTNPITETLADAEPLADALIEKAERDAVVEDGLSSLLPEDREILILHYAQELTFDEIGKMLERPLNTVKSRHRRALAKLRLFFEGKDI